MKIGELLKQLRINKRLTQEQVELRIKVSQPFLSQIERGKKEPSKKMLKNLCGLYDVPPIIVTWSLITEKDIPKSKLPLYRQLKPVIDSLVDEILELS